MADRAAQVNVGVDERLRHALRHATAVTLLVDIDGTILDVAGDLLHLAGVAPRHAVGRPVWSLADDDAGDIHDAWADAVDGRRSSCEIRLAAGEGGVRPVRIEFVDLLDDPDVHAVAATLHDISDLCRARRTLEHLTRHDALTGLANRTVLVEHLDDRLDIGSDVAVVFIDLDRFKPVNDLLGHEAGDQLLRQVADRLRQIVRTDDVVARVGGDEFVVLARPDTEPQDAVLLADRIEAALSDPYLLDEGPLRVTASVGLAIGGKGSTVTGMLADADLAMYEAKAARRGEPVRTAPRRPRNADERRRMADDLAIGLRRGEVIAHFQPLVDIRDGSTKGFEALVRWQHPRLGLLAPGEFLDIAEDAGLDPLLGDVVLRAACQVARTLPPSIHVSVNMSATQLADRNLAARVEAILAEYCVSPSQLVVEITERATLARRPGAGRVAPDQTLLQLHELGIMLSLDDFGTGYSSLTHVRHYPLNLIKIDRSFVARALEHREDRAVIAAVIGMATALDLHVVAEGIETDDQLHDLAELGCDLAQGYLCARPFPAGDVATWMAERGSDWQSSAA